MPWAIDYFRPHRRIAHRDEGFEFIASCREDDTGGHCCRRGGRDGLPQNERGRAVRSVFTLGASSFGGSSSWNQSAFSPTNGAVRLYGRPETLPPLETMKAPLLMLIAGADFHPAGSVSTTSNRKLTEPAAAQMPHLRGGRPTASSTGPSTSGGKPPMTRGAESFSLRSRSSS